MLARQWYQHLGMKKSTSDHKSSNDKRCTHSTSLYRRTPCLDHTTHSSNVEIPCTRFSTQYGTFSHAPQPRSYHLLETLSSVMAYMILTHHTHIRRRLPERKRITRHHTGTKQYSALSDPCAKAPLRAPRLGSSLREYAFVIDELHS
jgi:hypothetical protein